MSCRSSEEVTLDPVIVDLDPGAADLLTVEGPVALMTAFEAVNFTVMGNLEECQAVRALVRGLLAERGRGMFEGAQALVGFLQEGMPALSGWMLRRLPMLLGAVRAPQIVGMDAAKWNESMSATAYALDQALMEQVGLLPP